MTAQERFDEKWALNSATGCHEWTAGTDRDGYGQFDRDGYGQFDCDGKKHRAHRWIWEEKVGPIPEGRIMRHVTCSNPSCVRVEHLDPGTQAENMEDREEDGNTARGERNGRAKLTAEQVRDPPSLRRGRDELPAAGRRVQPGRPLDDRTGHPSGDVDPH